MSLRTRISAAAIGAVFAVGAAALPAQAADKNDGDLTKAKAVVTDGINDRLKTLGDLQARLAAYKDVPSADRDLLNDVLSHDVSGLTALKGKVAGETTVAAVRADGKAMVDDYRVYLLVAPKVHLTHVLTVENDALARLVKVHDALADKLAKDPKADTAANKDLLADMSTQIKDADAKLDGKLAALLGIQPGPDGKAIGEAVGDVKGAAKEARQDIRKAVDDAKKVREALKDTAAKG